MTSETKLGLVVPEGGSITKRLVQFLAAALFLAANALSAAGPQQQTAINRYCVTCHNTKTKTAGLALDAIGSVSVAQHPEEWEKVVRRLRTHNMPPAGLPRPAQPTSNYL